MSPTCELSVAHKVKGLTDFDFFWGGWGWGWGGGYVKKGEVNILGWG